MGHSTKIKKLMKNPWFQFMYLIAGLVSGCSYSINMVATRGTASDVVDETQNPAPNISPNIEVPLTPQI